MASNSGSSDHPARGLVPCVLVIAGLDPGGGAGLAQDVRAVRAVGAFACPVAATLTVQSTSGYVRQRVVPRDFVRAQAEVVLRHQNVRAIKTGALGSAANVAVVARLATARPDLPLVVDPVRIASRSARTSGPLLDGAGIDALASELVPLATLVTANADEAAALTGRRVKSVQDARMAARRLCEMGARAALVKGGHLVGRGDVVDVLAVADELIELAAPRLALGALHGGGCTLASFIAASMAKAPRGTADARVIQRAVRASRARHHAALVRAIAVGGKARVLNV